MRFNIVRSVKCPSLLLRTKTNYKWNFLDDMTPEDWLDLTIAQSTVPDIHTIRLYSFENRYDFYDSVRKNIRFILDQTKFAQSYLSNATKYNAGTLININYHSSIIARYNGFDLESAIKQKEFWKRLNDETKIETYFIDILKGTIDLEETSTLFDITPKKISTITV